MLYLLAGLLIGSFVAALTYRVPRSVPWALGRSFCPRCKKKLSWFDNIPLFSYLLLSGKCRNCKKRIPLRYPVIELVSGLSFVGLGSVWGNYFYSSPIELLFIVFLFIVTLSILVIDIEHQIIPDNMVFVAIASVFLYLVILDRPIYINLLSGFISAFFLLILHIITKGKGMGLGDVKFAILGGLV
ncbi:MAG: prepilin peptidase, partial [bacterium]